MTELATQTNPGTNQAVISAGVPAAASSALQKYNQAFVESFSLQESELGDSIAYNETAAWDSIGHMTMIAALEEAFKISIETDDVVNFSSYKKGMEILGKYGITF